MHSETRPVSETDVSKLVSLVGRQAAVKALECSDIIKVSGLRELATDLDIKGVAKAPKRELAERIVRRVDRRISKGVEELQALGRAGIRDYLDSTNCDAGDIRDFLERANLPAQAKMSRNDLMSFVAIQVESLGVFQRLSDPKRTASTRMSEAHKLAAYAR